MKYYVELNDERNKHLFMLMKDKYNVEQLDYEKLDSNDAIIFSPAKKLLISDARRIKPHTVVYCGNVQAEVSDFFKQNEIMHINFLKYELFAIQNAKLTAEGILCKLIESTPKSLLQQKVLIFGGGRLAKATVKLLSQINVYVVSQTYDICEYYNMHFFCNECLLGDEYIAKKEEYDVVINTIPAKHVKCEFENITYIETASVDSIEENAKKKLNYVYAPRLPQMYCSFDAAILMLNIIGGKI